MIYWTHLSFFSSIFVALSFFLALSTELCTSSRREKKSYVPQEGHLVERRGAMSEVTSREGHLIVKRGETSGVAGRR
jgi:endo-1,4-beta-D-glucanase Y